MMLQNWETIEDITVEDIMRYIKGPDFPTGGLILQDEGSVPLTTIYGTGNGTIKVRARTRIEEMSRGRMRIIVTELPFMVNKSALIERIAEISREGGLEGLSDMRDESDRQGMRIVIDLNKNADPEEVLATLYKRTQMHNTFAINILALVDGSPHRLTLKQALRVFAEHRLVVIRRRSEFLLKKNEDRLHILEALKIAIDHIDEVIRLIRRSASADEARTNLMNKYKLDEIQANAILEMPLRRLASLERKKIEEEYKEVSRTIADLKALLKSPKKMRDLAIEELKAIKQKFGDPRRTHPHRRRRSARNHGRRGGGAARGGRGAVALRGDQRAAALKAPQLWERPWPRWGAGQALAAMAAPTNLVSNRATQCGRPRPAAPHPDFAGISPFPCP